MEMKLRLRIEMEIKNGQGKLESRSPQPMAPRDKLEGPADMNTHIPVAILVQV